MGILWVVIDVVDDDLENEEVESKNMGSLEMEKEVEESEKESRAQHLHGNLLSFCHLLLCDDSGFTLFWRPN